jgi:hypothetical protein
MSASPIFSSAATGRPFIFPVTPSALLTARIAKDLAPKDPTKKKKTAEILAHVEATSKTSALLPASRLEIRPAPEMTPIGIPELDSLTGGFARGCLTEICGTASSGRTSILLYTLARATQRGEICALVDTSDAFDPASAAAAGTEMSRLLWIRCGEKLPTRQHPRNSYSLSNDSYQSVPSGRQITKNRSDFSRWQSQLAQLLKVTDLLLQSNGFGVIALDLSDVPASSARKIPLASWFRFRRAIEHTPTVLLVLEQQPIAGSCSSTLLKLSAVRSPRSNKHPSGIQQSENQTTHSELLDQFEITAELLRTKLKPKPERKPMQSTTSFKSRAAWAG